MNEPLPAWHPGMNQGAFYDALAPRYDALLATPRERWIRRGFQALVQEVVPAGSWILDAGCGTGIDAAWYASHGYRVLAHDISSGMIGQLRRRCPQEIADGRIIPLVTPLADLPAIMNAQPQPGAIVANYGLINALPEPAEFFRATAPLLSPGQPLLVSSLNPFYWRDTTQPWWWNALRRSGFRAIISHGEGLDTHRHFIPAIVTAARPAFRLKQQASLGWIVPGNGTAPDWERPQSMAERTEARLWKAFPFHSFGLWVFLVFERT